MTVAGWVALAIAICGAFGYAAASILQAVGARRSTGTVRTLGHPLYLIGTACDVLAWAGSMIALRELAVYLVESVLAGSLAVTVVAARLFLKSRLRKRDVAATVVSVAALTVLAMSAGPQESVAASNGTWLWFCVAALATAVIGWGSAKIGSPGVVAAVAGLSFGGAALAVRALSLPAQPMEHVGATALAVVTEPLIAALVTFAATGMLLYTHALQHGQVGPVTAVLWIAEVIAPSAVALVLLGDTVRPGWELAAAVAGWVTVGAAVMLATAPANGATACPPDAIAAAPRPELPARPRPALPAASRLALPAAPRPALPAASRKALPAAPRPALPAVPRRALPAVPRRALPAAPRRALPAVPRPALPAAAQPGDGRQAERIIWWGPPPIWIPPGRTNAALAASPVAALGWNPPPAAEAIWTDPQPPYADPAEIPRPQSPAPVGWPAPQPSPEHRVEPARSRPWHDL